VDRSHGDLGFQGQGFLISKERPMLHTQRRREAAAAAAAANKARQRFGWGLWPAFNYGIPANQRLLMRKEKKTTPLLDA
jgi:hypothetical protein